jgi:cytochrome c-type biogenesis protein CcmE
VVSLGRLRADRVFDAFEDLPKPNEIYTPKDVEDALKKSGHWNPDQGPPPPASTWNNLTTAKAGE